MKINASYKILAAALMITAAPWIVVPVAAAPISSSLGLQNALAPLAETVQYRRGWRGGYRGSRYGSGIVAGAIIGGALLGTTQPYGYDGYGPGYAYGPGYSPGYYGYGSGAPYAGGGEVAYCQQRFRSYDPGSGTYLGFDGFRHPCP